MNFIEFGRRFPASRLLLLTCLITPVVLASRALATIMGKRDTTGIAEPGAETPEYTSLEPVDPNTFFTTIHTLGIQVLEPNERRPIKGPWVIFEPGCFDRFEGDQQSLDALVHQLESDLVTRISDGELVGPVIVRAHKSPTPQHRAQKLN